MGDFIDVDTAVVCLLLVVTVPALFEIKIFFVKEQDIQYNDYRLIVVLFLYHNNLPLNSSVTYGFTTFYTINYNKMF